jgi:hypothetical protein
MESASKRIGGGPGGKKDNLLKGSDLPLKTQKISVVCTGIREAPKNFGSPYIMDIETVYEKSEWAINKSNTGALITLIDDDPEKWIGWEIEVAKFLTNNPSTKTQAWGLMIVGAQKLKRKVKAAEQPVSKF